jgi:hypothetical protein
VVLVEDEDLEDARGEDPSCFAQVGALTPQTSSAPPAAAMATPR